ncbi:MAG TPA: septal ring lytic transglycosylase RlpA family protein [Spirillospora sp.]
MRNPVIRLVRARLRIVLIVLGAVAAMLTLCAFALVKGEDSTKSARAAQPAPTSAQPLGDAPRTRPSPSSRGGTRSPEASPTTTGSAGTKAPKEDRDAKADRVAEPKPKKKKKKREVLESGSCMASYYWQGQMTASGEPFDPNDLTAAHRTLPMGSKVRVTNKNNGRSVVVRINDRGPFVAGRCLDLSRAAMKKLRGTGAGVIPVRYEVLSRG